MKKITLYNLLAFCLLVPSVASTQMSSLDEKTAAEMRELDRKLLEAHEKLDARMAMSTFTEKEDAFFIEPSGRLNKGTEAIRKSWENFFASLDSIHGDIKDISYFREGDGVIAVGMVVYKRKMKNHEPEEKVVIWTDYRRKENAKWVYVFRHAHWPVSPPPY